MNMMQLTFAVQKLCMKQSGAEYLDWLEECQATGLEMLEALVNDHKQVWIEQYEESMKGYSKSYL
jgi:hypothetical protein